VSPVLVGVSDDLAWWRCPVRRVVVGRVGVADRGRVVPLTNAPRSVERTHASVCAPATTRRPTPRPDSTVSRVVASKASP
jgi:hypothetical protein